MEIRSDSEYVVKGCESRRFVWRRIGWRRVKNADLWQELDRELMSMPPGRVRFTKVKGHAKEQDVVRGRVAREDKIGNDAADKLAVCGALQHE
eukprot:3528891-Karenia_brevis.AAC.1